MRETLVHQMSPITWNVLFLPVPLRSTPLRPSQRVMGTYPKRNNLSLLDKCIVRKSSTSSSPPSGSRTQVSLGRRPVESQHRQLFAIPRLPNSVRSGESLFVLAQIYFVCNGTSPAIDLDPLVVPGLVSRQFPTTFKDWMNRQHQLFYYSKIWSDHEVCNTWNLLQGVSPLHGLKA